jgi:hypothetical protein
MRELISASFHIAAAVLALMTLIPAALMMYWAVDRKMPIRHITGRFVAWESLNPAVARIQWSGERSRLCLGQTKSWVHTESPINLPATALPHKDSVTNSGDGPVRWMESIPIPDEAFGNRETSMTLNVRFTWYCNPLQEYWPLELDANPIPLPVPDSLK